ncbi:hypothetical protein VTK73DRAFT_10411 [Phialemonium thermophilum]|uniref:AB hydrolase-1 domain-containing protein n=1 Tax=Phialemonium thermophilum TaxID=223376 RepID=A0ABR3VWW6_9PEZI
MPYFTSPVDSTTLYYKYYRPGATAFRPLDQPASPLALVFLHGWPMSSDMFEHLLVPLCETYRLRIVAPDRRGFGKSDWSSAATVSIDYDVFVADLVALLEHLDIGPFVFVGASMGCPESVLAYLQSRFVQERCQGFMWLGPNMPFPLQSPEHPLSPSADVWDAILDGLRGDKAQYVSDALPGIFALQAGNELSAKTLERFERLVHEADGVALERTAKIIQRDTGDELRRLGEGKQLPIRILHGSADQGMPLEASAALVKEMLPWSELKVYENAGHGLYLTHAKQVLDDIVEFVQSIPRGGQK